LDDVSVHESIICELVVAVPVRLVGAVSGVYVNVAAIRERRAPLLFGADVSTAPISSVVAEPFVMDRLLNDVVARSPMVVLVNE
jgi:hypothetical protein